MEGPKREGGKEEEEGGEINPLTLFTLAARTHTHTHRPGDEETHTHPAHKSAKHSANITSL